MADMEIYDIGFEPITNTIYAPPLKEENESFRKFSKFSKFIKFIKLIKKFTKKMMALKGYLFFNCYHHELS